jgi:hypothetical protein
MKSSIAVLALLGMVSATELEHHHTHDLIELGEDKSAATIVAKSAKAAKKAVVAKAAAKPVKAKAVVKAEDDSSSSSDSEEGECGCSDDKAAAKAENKAEK